MAAETRFLVFDNSMTLRWDQCENVGLPHSHWKIVWEPVDSFIARPVTQTCAPLMYRADGVDVAPEMERN